MDRSANNKKLLSFLVYSYFGFDISKLADGELTDDEKKKCARRAYMDLSRTIKYKYSSSELDKAKKDSDKYNYKVNRNTTILHICNDLIDSIKNYPGDNADFDSWHKSVCQQIESTMNNKKLELLKEKFTIGQAQKWVNMTLKYLWLLDMLPEGISETDLHVPIDSFILKALEEKNISDISHKDGTYKYNGETWSRLGTYEKYKRLQEEIKKVADDNPIYWESKAWIEVATAKSNN